MPLFEKIHTDLQLIFGMLKNRGQGTAMQEYMEKHREYFSSVTMETYQAVRELLHSEAQLKHIRTMKDGKESLNMCKALDDIYNNGLNAGINAGKQELLSQQIQKKLSKGYSAEMIADMLEVEIETVQKVIEEM